MVARYRSVYINIWKDPDFENYNPQAKLIFLYLCTNSETTESGIYPITIRTISNETGIGIKIVSKLLDGNYKNVEYDKENHIIFIKNFLKYNGGGRPDLLKKSIEKDYRLFKTSLWNEFINTYPELSTGLKQTTPISSPISSPNSKSISKEQLANSCTTVGKQLESGNQKKETSELSREEKQNYAKGMEAEREWQKEKEKPDNQIEEEY